MFVKPFVVVLEAWVPPAYRNAKLLWLAKVSMVTVPMAESAAMNCPRIFPAALVAGDPPVFWLTVSCVPEAGDRLVPPM